MLLLDETITNLDKHAQVYLKKNLDKIGAGKTLVIASNDLRFVLDFDWILVLDKGEVVGQGQHKDLMKQCPLYVQLIEMEKTLSFDT